MGYQDLFGIYEIKNAELKGLATFCYEAALNIAGEASGAMAIGLDPHAVARHTAYVAAAKSRVEALRDRPYPDMPQTHRTLLVCDFSAIPAFEVDPVTGVELNADIETIMTMWMQTAVELVRSNSAALAGSMLDFDYNRCIANIEAIEQLVPTMDIELQKVDFARTAVPEAKTNTRAKK